jgi:hypothetical protein
MEKNQKLQISINENLKSSNINIIKNKNILLQNFLAEKFLTDCKITHKNSNLEIE